MVFFTIRRSLAGFLCLLSFTLFAQITTFQKTYGGPGSDIATDLLELSDGYLIVGYTFDPGTSNQNGLLIRTDKDGAVLWQKSYGGFGNDILQVVKPANNGGFILWGNTRPLGGTYTDAWLLQVDDNGNMLWQKTIGQQNFNESARGDIFNMPDGYILSGEKSKPGYVQTFVIRVDNNGETLWSEFTPSDDYNSLAVEIMNDSTLFLSGSVNDFASLRTMNANTGAIIQSTEYRLTEIPGVDEHIWLYDMGQLPNRDLIVCGDYYIDVPGLIRIEGYLQRLSPEGVPAWTKLYKVGLQNLSWQIHTLPDGSSVFSMTHYTAFNQADIRTILIKIDENGDVLWAHQYGGMNLTQVVKIIQTADGGLLSLATLDRGGQVQQEMMLLKTDAEGNVAGCCTINIDVTVTEVPPFTSHEPFIQTPFEPTIPRDVPNTATPDLLAGDFCANAQPLLQDTIALCPGQGITLGDSTYFEATTVTRTLPSSTGGCDTLATYTLGLVPQPTLQQTILLCPGESVSLGGNIFSQPGTVTLTLPSTTGGCDTIATYTLEIVPQPTVQQTILLCPGESVSLGGNIFSQPGTVTLTLPATTGGCDTIATYTLEIAPQPTLQQTILLCPGESVSLGGNVFSQPGTVTLTLPATNGGCDTIATYTLDFKTSNQPNTVQVTCPANQVVTVPGGTLSIAVSYGPATVLSDCPCPGSAAMLQSGKASGEQFPLGLSTLCYRGEDACGNTRSCCFTVTVEEESGCDEKNSGCLTFELLKVNRDAAKNWVYYVRITNQCNSALRYAWLQVPDGLPALEPAGGNVYTTANGRNYELRNPNFSPFYSLRFKPVATGLIGGESDVFRYVLPQQASVEYIHAAVRLESGAYYETHLNTFHCTTGTEPQQKQALAARNEQPAGQPRLSIFPNPTVSGSTLTLEGQAIADGIFELRDLTGRAIARLPIAANQVSLHTGETGAGVYFFHVFENGRQAGTGKLVLLR